MSPLSRGLLVLCLLGPAWAPVAASIKVSVRKDPEHAAKSLDSLEQTLRDSFTGLKLEPVKTEEAEDQMKALAPEALAPLKARWEILSKEASQLRALQEAVTAAPSSAQGAEESRKITGMVGQIAELLNGPESGKIRAPLDRDSLTKAYLGLRAARNSGTSGAQPGLSKLLDESRALEAKLASGKTDPEKTARRVAELMDGLQRRADLTALVQGSDYREIVSTLDRGLAYAKKAPALSSGRKMLLDESRAGLDQRLSQILKEAAPDSAKPGSSWLDDVTVCFHASLRQLLPATSAMLWERFGSREPRDVDQHKINVYVAAIDRARPEFQAAYSKVPAKQFNFVGGFDGTYMTRVGSHGQGNNVGEAAGQYDYGVGTPQRLAELEKTYRSWSILPPYLRTSAERLVLGTMRAVGMMKGAKPGQYIVPKHFPGGPPELELTEGRMVEIQGGFKELSPYLAPFLAILSQRPPALMIGHAQYPEWEIKELRPRWPSLPSVACGGCVFPATFSPYIIRGFLRDGLQYKGLVVADWLNMGAINSFLERIRPRMPEEMQTMINSSQMVILGSYAGLNWMPGFPAFGTTVMQVESYYKSSAEFRSVFDGLVTETARLRGASVPKTMKEKIHLLTRNEDQQYGKENFADIWSRGGLMILSFRVSMLNHIHGAAFQNLCDIKRKSNPRDAEEKWLNYLQSDPEFMRLYKSIDWDGPEMQAAFFKYFQSFPQSAGTPKR